MITFSLKCENNHQFEGWFRSSDDYEDQEKNGLISCPTCNNKRISNGFSYLVIVALEDFTKDTASTQFIKDSFRNFKKPKRFAQKKYNTLKMKTGSVCIMDTGITHRGGISTKTSRWSIFNIYSPWFVKPYFNYQKLLGNKGKKLNKKEKKILHFFSEPPTSHNERVNTIISY